MDLQQLVQDVLNGEESGLVALAVLKEEKKIIEECIKQVEETAQEEAAQYNEKTFQHKDLIIEKRSGGRVYSFKGLLDWEVKNAELKEIEDKYKQAYLSYEKNIHSVTQDGEVLELPKVVNKKDSLIIKRIDI